VTVAILADRVVGFAAVRAGFLDHLYVTPDAQSRGVGSRLLAAAKAARLDGLRLYVFQRNTNACGFYEKRGFTLVALDDGTRNEEGEPDALYEWRGGLGHLHRRGR
jgi:ribosomal protein S18 acetylase RimI-like enzyme